MRPQSVSDTAALNAPLPSGSLHTRAFLRARIIGLTARARRLSRIDYASVGIRPQDLPYVPSVAHFRAANERLALIDREIVRHLGALQRRWPHAGP